VRFLGFCLCHQSTLCKSAFFFISFAKKIEEQMWLDSEYHFGLIITKIDQKIVNKKMTTF